VRPGPRKCPTPTKAAHLPAPNRGAWRATTQPTRRPARPRECRPSAADAVGMPVDGDRGRITEGAGGRRPVSHPSSLRRGRGMRSAPATGRVPASGAWTPSLHGRGISRATTGREQHRPAATTTTAENPRCDAPDRSPGPCSCATGQGDLRGLRNLDDTACRTGEGCWVECGCSWEGSLWPRLPTGHWRRCMSGW